MTAEPSSQTACENARRWAVRGCAIAVLVCCGIPTYAQRSSTVYYSRPSTTSASSSLGRVGGTYTGDANAPLQTLRGASGGINQLAGSRGFSRGGHPVTGSLGMHLMRRASSLDMPLRGSAIRTGFRNRTISPGGVTGGEIMISSGFSASTRFHTPINGWRFAPPPLDTPMFPVPLQQDRFQQFFGLVPPRKPGVIQNAESLSQVLQLQNADRLDTLRRRALAAFKEERYSDAMVLLESVREADPANSLASLLGAQAAMEQKQFWRAIVCVLEACRRNPRVFVERPDVRAHYANPGKFEARLRENARGASALTTWPAVLLRCYCAWQLGETGNAREALQQLITLSKKEAATDAAVIQQFAHAMRAALN